MAPRVPGLFLGSLAEFFIQGACDGLPIALSLELRAATSLAALMEGTSRQAEARVLLAAFVERFEEGFDTSDLLRAASMLKKL